MSVKIFYDGAVFGEYDKHPDVVGFTTNTSYVAASIAQTMLWNVRMVDRFPFRLLDLV